MHRIKCSICSRERASKQSGYTEPIQQHNYLVSDATMSYYTCSLVLHLYDYLPRRHILRLLEGSGFDHLCHQIWGLHIPAYTYRKLGDS